MTASNLLTIIVLGIVVVGWGSRAYAQDDVTIVSTPATKSSTSAKKPGTASDDSTPVHKSSHKKKKKTATATTDTTNASSTAATSGSGKSSSSATASAKKTTGQKSTGASTTTTSATAATTSASSTQAKVTTSATPVNPLPTTAPSPAKTVVSVLAAPSTKDGSAGPSVETGLPVARRTGADELASFSVPKTSGSLSPGLQNPTSFRSTTTASRSTSPSSDFVFTNFTKSKRTYPWKTGIITTMFYIGEGGSSISPTDNKSSSWVEDWVSANRGTDNPNHRNGYATADHASTINPFYVALPFNDLYCPDKARRWLPPSWHRPPKDGKQVSACKDRWVQIKNAQGRSCFAQWEDVGPLRYDHAEYVFGPERPDTYTRAGLDVSPAVAQYLGINQTAITSWRFVDEEDVIPGEWLKYDELALLYQAMHQQKSSTTSSNVPIQRNSEPIDDSSDDTNKKRVGAAKG